MPLHPKGTDPLIQLPEVLAIGFTGHRSLPDEAGSRQAIRNFLARQKESHQGIVYGVSSAASGGDQIFAESCIELGIPIRILLPRPAPQFRSDFDEASWQRTQRILNAAISVETVTGSEDQNEQYYDCGVRTVSDCQLLIALWNGLPSRGAGGTEEMIDYARKIGYPVAWIHSQTGALEWFNQYARARSESNAELEFLNLLPDAGAATASGNSRELAHAWFCKIDENADRFAPQARRLASVPIIYTAIAAVVSGVAPEIPNAAPWLFISAGLGVVALGLPAVLSLHLRQARWARTRTAAEIARSFLAVWCTPQPYNVIGEETAPWLAAILRSLNFLKIHDQGRSQVPLAEFKKEYHRDRVLDQMEYFANQSARAEKQEKRYSTLGWACGILATLVALGCFSGGLAWLVRHGFSGRLWIAAIMSTLFETATMAGAFAAMKDCARRRRRYRELSRALGYWGKQLEALNTWNSVLEVVGEIERVLLVELFEWRSLVLGAGTHNH